MRKLRTTESEFTWVVDLGASLSLINDKRRLVNAKGCTGITVKTADSTVFAAKCVGEAHINGMIIPKAYYVPGINTNLLSVRDLEDLGMEINFKDGKCVIENQSLQIIGYIMHDNLYHIRDAQTFQVNTAQKIPEDLLWHQRLGHPSQESTLNTSRLTEKSGEIGNCVVCV